MLVPAVTWGIARGGNFRGYGGIETRRKLGIARVRIESRCPPFDIARKGDDRVNAACGVELFMQDGAPGRRGFFGMVDRNW